MTIRTILTLLAGAAIGYGGEVAPVVQNQACVNCAVPAATSVTSEQHYQIPIVARTTTSTDWQQGPMQAVGTVQQAECATCTAVQPACSTAAPACVTAPVQAQAGCGLFGKLRGCKARLKSRRASRRASRAGC
jgi:hypothetical protein